ncbi:MAG: nucleotidyltransferase domain-containing protein [Nanoarchaeota archaeon]
MKIIKEAIAMGNGAAVYVPKEYSGRQVLVVVEENIEEIQKRIMSKLIPYLSNIIGVYLYGSYARKEQSIDSDIDVLVVTYTKEEHIKSELKDIDARIITLESIKKTAQNYPLFIIPMLREAVVFSNPLLLEEINKIQVDPRKFDWHLEEIERTIEIIESFLARDRTEKVSATYLVSIVIRLRACYLIQCILRNDKYTHQRFKQMLIKRELKENEIEEAQTLYREIRHKEETSLKVKRDNVQKFLELLKEYLQEIKNEKRKKTQKRN